MRLKAEKGVRLRETQQAMLGSPGPPVSGGNLRNSSWAFFPLAPASHAVLVWVLFPVSFPGTSH